MLQIGNSTEGRLPLDASTSGQVIQAVTLSDGSRGASSFADTKSGRAGDQEDVVESGSSGAMNVSDELLLSSQPKPEADNPFIVLVRHRFKAEIEV